MSLHKMCVQNCPLLFRLRPAQVNDCVTKSVLSCKGPTCKEAELHLFSASMHTRNFIHKSHSQLLCSMDHPKRSIGCSNTVPAATLTLLSNFPTMGEHHQTPSHPKDESRTSQGAREMMKLWVSPAGHPSVNLLKTDLTFLKQDRNCMPGVKSL